MFEFFAALTLFFAVHVIPARTGLRAEAVRRLGERVYVIFYSLSSIAILAWVISAALRAPFIALWSPANWTYAIPILVMPASFMLMAGAVAQPNPLSIAFSRSEFDSADPGIVAVTRHPILWSFGIWAGAHIPPNGDLVSVILFGILSLFAFSGMRLLDHKSRLALGSERWQMLAGKTSILPFAAIMQGRANWPGGIAYYLGLAIGLILYAAFLILFHELWFGIAPLSRL